MLTILEEGLRIFLLQVEPQNMVGENFLTPGFSGRGKTALLTECGSFLKG